MNSIKKLMCQKRGGIALIMSMIFVLVFSVLAVSLATMSGTNVQVSKNQRTANRAFSSAQSGLDVLRYWLEQVRMPFDTPQDEMFGELLTDVENVASIGNINTTSDAMNISNVTTNSALGNSFSAQIQPITDPNDPYDVQLDVKGFAGNLERVIRVKYKYDINYHNVFDYGIATRGPLQLTGNIELTGQNITVNSSVYVESDVCEDTLAIIGNSSIAGDCYFTNPDADIDLQGGQASIGGETGEDALDHCHVGVDPVEFPVPMPTHFEQYVQTTFDPNDIQTEYDNVRIPAGTNPTFSSDVTFEGVVYVEVPNVIRFEGHVDITGIIIGNGDLNDNSGTNRIDFLGTVSSHPVTELPETDPQFEQLRNETGTFLMAPGFGVSFGGNFDTLNGCIAANGVEFFGNAGGSIDGSILNYSDTPMDLSGNSNLFFFRSGTDEVPAGFGPDTILRYIPDSYSEIVL